MMAKIQNYPTLNLRIVKTPKGEFLCGGQTILSACNNRQPVGEGSKVKYKILSISYTHTEIQDLKVINKTKVKTKQNKNKPTPFNMKFAVRL